MKHFLKHLLTQLADVDHKSNKSQIIGKPVVKNIEIFKPEGILLVSYLSPLSLVRQASQKSQKSLDHSPACAERESLKSLLPANQKKDGYGQGYQQNCC